MKYISLILKSTSLFVIGLTLLGMIAAGLKEWINAFSNKTKWQPTNMQMARAEEICTEKGFDNWHNLTPDYVSCGYKIPMEERELDLGNSIRIETKDWRSYDFVYYSDRDELKIEWTEGTQTMIKTMFPDKECTFSETGFKCSLSKK